MDHLSSCYFCGVALEEPLQEYPIVPAEFGDGGPTATLCPSCHRKLETVLDAVVEAADAGDGASIGAPTDDTDERETTDHPGETTGTAAEESAGEDLGADATADSDEASIVDDPAVGSERADDLLVDPGEKQGAPEPDTERTDAEDGEPDRDESGDKESTTADTGREEESVTAEDIEEMAGDVDPDILDGESERDDEDDLQSAMEPDVPEELQSGDESVSEPRDADDDSGSQDRDATGASDDGGDAARDADAAEADTAEADVVDPDTADAADEESGDEADAPASRTTVSALEYNKVMRLLQNREFPVDRAEIQTVAANAYGLAESECAAVIDLAIDRGLVDEQDGKLVRP